MSERLQIRFPVWILVDDHALAEKGLPDALAGISETPDGPKAIPIYTRIDLAREALDKMPNGLQRLAIGTKEVLRAILMKASQKKENYVSIDFPPEGFKSPHDKRETASVVASLAEEGSNAG